MSTSSQNATSRGVFKITVTGDVTVDHHIYEGERTTAAAYDRSGFRVVREHGGAARLHRLLESLLEAAKAQPRLAAEENVRKAWNRLRDVQHQGVSDIVATAKNSLEAAEKQLSEIEPAREETCSLRLAIELPEIHGTPSRNHSMATWKPFPKDPVAGKEKVWRANALLGYGDIEATQNSLKTRLDFSEPENLLIIDDVGFAFRHKDQAEKWLLPVAGKSNPDWILLKMSGPLCRGDLWHALSGTFGQRLICVVSANDLRAECVSLSRGLSWERTVEDVRTSLSNHPILRTLATIPHHLVITFSADGALWLDNSDRDHPRVTLIYDSEGAHGEWADKFDGKAFGYLHCLVVSIARVLIHDSNRPAFGPAIAAGLAAMRDLLLLGHGAVSDDPPGGFPAQRLAAVLLKGSGKFSYTRVPWSETEKKAYESGPAESSWRIVEMSQSPFAGEQVPSLLGLARQVVLQGRSAIQRLPHAKFGGLLTADRFEIEALRNIRRTMLSYRQQQKADKPLSVGVFGPPGAGKSFGVKQIANEIFGEKSWLSFNLSQFKDTRDLIGAFHQVRDLVLSGLTPVVFWDEFDSKEYEWLQYLLAPMQDGRFQDGQLNHAIGKCVFVFAGGTSSTFEEFGPEKSDIAAYRTYRLKKGPDFHSRLDAFYNVPGPNQRQIRCTSGSPPITQWVPDASDVCAPLRRALLIRALLNVSENARLDFDPQLLDALLRVRSFKHGARSLEKLVTSLRPGSGSGPIRRSALPPVSQIAMHVDTDNAHPELSFEKLLVSGEDFVVSEAIPATAEAIHDVWRATASSTNKLNRPWADLTESEREDNRAAARRIPEVIALAGLSVVKHHPTINNEISGAQDQIDRQIEHHLERLAEAEHDLWMYQRIRNGWSYDPNRDDERKKHPLLIRYSDLPESEKNKDRVSVRNYRKLLQKAGYEIVFDRAT